MGLQRHHDQVSRVGDEAKANLRVIARCMRIAGGPFSARMRKHPSTPKKAKKVAPIPPPVFQLLFTEALYIYPT